MSNHANVYIRNERDEELEEYASRLAEKIQLTAAKYDENGEFPFEHFELLQKEGYFKLPIPKEYGGEGLSLYELILVQESLAKGSGSTALAVGWHLMAFFSLSCSRTWKEKDYKKLCQDAVHNGSLLNVFATERDSGNIARGNKPTTTARKVDGGFVISGRKAFATLAPYLKHFTVMAFIEDENRVAEFLIEKNESVNIIPTWNTLGMRSTGSDDVELNNVFVKKDALLAYADKLVINRFEAFSKAYSLLLPTVYLGVASAARDFIIHYAEKKYSPSLGNVISEAPHVKQKIGEIDMLLSVSRTLLYSLAEKWDENIDLRDKLKNEVSIAKYMVTNNAIKIVELAMSIAGGHSISKDFPLERYFRDVQCGLYNPPHNDMVISQIATSALEEYRKDQVALQHN
ncbi:acyl-CoA dehydrogenase family protein [Bacillus salipaludis]|uniref:acyl-CoA dehydrogenase family protein n=1 Tax=Bacillus salipaludis TaxID=2547811 RepID=UPI002E1AD931|nr:acyl-CoA/acyl-ACP dehydrogenase [Bacillus salipaludis]